MMTFDSEEELNKVKRIHPDAKLVLRFSIYDPSADFPMGIKFGCKIENAPCLLEKAKRLGLNVIGTSFHIGSGSHDPSTFELAIESARKVFDEGAKYGFKMNFLDIGGGFPGKKNMRPEDVKFEKFAEAVNNSLKKHFHDDSAVKVIAEPGRFFSESAGTIVTIVHGKRRKTYPHDESIDKTPGVEGCKLKGFDYFVNNGVCASFARNLHHYGDVIPVPVDEKKLNEPKYEATIYGNTCAEVDTITERCELPELNIGDWIYYEDIGAYQSIHDGTFNGFKNPVKLNFVFTQETSSLNGLLTADEKPNIKDRPLQKLEEERVMPVKTRPNTTVEEVSKLAQDLEYFGVNDNRQTVEMELGHVLDDCIYERGNKTDVIKHNILEHKQRQREDEDDSFMLFDLGDVFKKYFVWKGALPRVTPFYVVRCNPDEAVLRLLSRLNCGFGCASKGELQLLLETIKVNPERIINFSTWKQESHLKYAKEHDVKIMTFDSEEELVKVKQIHPDAKLVLRLFVFNPSADFSLGIKFGCKIENAPCVLKKAKELKLDVTGVSFHIGSASPNPSIIEVAIAAARKVFDEGAKCGFKMNLLDIGGGFPGKKNMGPEDVKFEEFADAVNKGLKKHFPEKSTVKVIAEPGRFFNETAGTLVTNVHGKRRKSYPDEKNGLGGRKLKGFDYFVNNGIFASFACKLLRYGEVMPVPVDENKLNEPKYDTTVYGNTAAEDDLCNEQCELPELNIGDWIYYEDIGAYHYWNDGTFNAFKSPTNYAFPKELLYIDKLQHEKYHSEDQALQEQSGDTAVAGEGISLGSGLIPVQGIVPITLLEEALELALEDNEHYFCLNENC